jgi:hypothetical protein
MPRRRPSKARNLNIFAVSCRRLGWQKVPIVMLTACFDAGGKELDHRVVVVGGFAGMATVWTEFQSLWNARLLADGLTEFHSGDFAQFRNAFKVGWKNDEPRRRLLRGLKGIIEQCGLRKFGTVVPVRSQLQIDQGLRERLFLGNVRNSVESSDSRVIHFTTPFSV